MTQGPATSDRQRPALAMKAALLAVILAALTGCMYPGDEAPNQAAVQDGLTLVQTAVDAYRADTGLLPIKNYDMTTPLYEQNVIDFTKLTERGMLGSIPSNAFEQGGSNYYVIVNPEQDPTVRLLDLVSLQLTGDAERNVQAYRGKHYGRIPAGEQAYPGWYTIDFEELNTAKPEIISPYSRIPLELLTALDGTVVIDYAPEIRKALELQGVTAPPESQDLREYLVESAYYVPVKSHAYVWKNGEPTLAPPYAE